MGNKITYKLKSNDKTNLINVPIGDDFFPVDNTELVDKEVEKTVQRSINNISDWEKTIYRIVCNDQSEGQCINLDFNLWDEVNGATTDDWVQGGVFLSEDVEYKTQRYRGSFFRISYFTTPHRETQKLVSYSNIPLTDQTEARIQICKDSPGGSLYFWKSEEKLNITSNRLYMKVEFFNSADGGVDIFSTILPDSTGAFPIEFYNEKMDYIPILLNHKTRTFEMEPILYWYDDFGTQELYEYKYFAPCGFSLMMKRIHAITANSTPAQTPGPSGPTGPGAPTGAAGADNEVGVGFELQDQMPFNFSLPPLPEQQTLEEVVVTPQPETLNSLMPSLPEATRRSVRRFRKTFPSFATHSLRTRYSGGTITPTTPIIE